MESAAKCFVVPTTPSTVWPSIRANSMPAAMTSLSLSGTFTTFLEVNIIFNTRIFLDTAHGLTVLHEIPE